MKVSYSYSYKINLEVVWRKPISIKEDAIDSHFKVSFLVV